MKFKLIFTISLTMLLIIGCADVAHLDPATTVDDPYGFWGGFWHGFIVIFAFIGSLFSDDIAMYAINNNGGFYDFGFVIGSGILSFSIGNSSKK